MAVSLNCQWNVLLGKCSIPFCSQKNMLSVKFTSEGRLEWFVTQAITSTHIILQTRVLLCTGLICWEGMLLVMWSLLTFCHLICVVTFLMAKTPFHQVYANCCTLMLPSMTQKPRSQCRHQTASPHPQTPVELEMVPMVCVFTSSLSILCCSHTLFWTPFSTPQQLGGGLPCILNSISCPSKELITYLGVWVAHIKYILMYGDCLLC